MRRRVLHLLVEKATLTAVHLERRRGGITVVAARRFRREREERALRVYLHEHPLATRRAWVVLPDEEIALREILLPAVKGQKRKQVIRGVVENLAHGPYAHTALCDLGAAPAGGAGRRALLAAWNGDRVRAALAAAERLGLRVAGVSPLAVALLAAPGGSDGPELVAYVGGEAVALVLREGKTLRFTHTSGRMPPPAWLYPDEAWEYPPPWPETPPPADPSDCRPFVEGLQRVLTYLAAERYPAPRRLYLLGRLRRAPALDAFLGEELRLPVVRPRGASPPPLADLYTPLLGLARAAAARRALDLAAAHRPARPRGARLRRLLRPAATAAATAALTWGALEHARLLAARPALRAAEAAARPPLPPPPTPPPDPSAPVRRYLRASPLPHLLHVLARHTGPSLTLTRLELVWEGEGWTASLAGIGRPRKGAEPAAQFGALLARLEVCPWVKRIESAPWRVARELRFSCRVHICAAVRPAGGGGRERREE